MAVASLKHTNVTESITTTECKEQLKNINSGNPSQMNIDAFLLAITRIIDCKHDFVGSDNPNSRSNLLPNHCNDFIINTPGFLQSEYTLHKYLCNDNSQILLHSGILSSNPITLHKIIMFDEDNIPLYTQGDYYKVAVADANNNIMRYNNRNLEYCVERPFSGYYDFTSPKFNSEIERLIKDRTLYGKRAIYNIDFGDTLDDDTTKQQALIKELNNIFEFNETNYTIDASKIRKKFLEELYAKPSVTGVGDRMDPATTRNEGVVSGGYDTTLHLCIIRGESLSIQIQSQLPAVTDINYTLYYNGKFQTFKFSLNDPPSVKDISNYIIDLKKQKNCLLSLLSSVIPKKTGNKHVANNYINFFGELIKSASKLIKTPVLNIDEISFAVASIKTIGDQLRMKDAQMFDADLITLDNFLFDICVATNACRCIGEITTGNKVTGFKIFESRDLGATLISLNGLLRGWLDEDNKNKIEPILNEAPSSTNIETQIQARLSLINEIKGEEEAKQQTELKKARDASDLQEVNDIIKQIGLIKPTDVKLMEGVLNSTVVISSDKRRRISQPFELVQINLNGSTVTQFEHQIIYRRLQFQYAFEFFWENFKGIINKPVDVNDAVPLHLIKELGSIYEDYTSNYYPSKPIAAIQPPIDEFMTVVASLNSIIKYDLLPDMTSRLDKVRKANFMYRTNPSFFASESYLKNSNYKDYFNPLVTNSTRGGVNSNVIMEDATTESMEDATTEYMTMVTKLYVYYYHNDFMTKPPSQALKQFFLYTLYQRTTELNNLLISLDTGIYEYLDNVPEFDEFDEFLGLFLKNKNNFPFETNDFYDKLQKDFLKDIIVFDKSGNSEVIDYKEILKLDNNGNITLDAAFNAAFDAVFDDLFKQPTPSNHYAMEIGSHKKAILDDAVTEVKQNKKRAHTVTVSSDNDIDEDNNVIANNAKHKRVKLARAGAKRNKNKTKRNKNITKRKKNKTRRKKNTTKRKKNTTNKQYK